jgi:hypothetical protein
MLPKLLRRLEATDGGPPGPDPRSVGAPPLLGGRAPAPAWLTRAPAPDTDRTAAATTPAAAEGATASRAVAGGLAGEGAADCGLLSV